MEAGGIGRGVGRWGRGGTGKSRSSVAPADYKRL